MGLEELTLVTKEAQTKMKLHSIPCKHYEVSVTQLSVGTNLSDLLDLSAIFDSGTSSFTSLSEPAYTVIRESFDSQVLHKRLSSDSRIPFEYCYGVSLNSTEFHIPKVSLMMKGGGQLNVSDPIVSFTNGVSCLHTLG